MTTSIYIQNTSNQALVLNNSVSPYLAPSYWAALVSSLPAFMATDEKVMWFSRNDGIGKGSTWVFTSAFVLGGTQVSFAEQLTGTGGGSDMMQSITAGDASTGWQDFNDKGPTFTFVAANGVSYSVNWDLTVNGQGRRDIHYTVSPT